MILVSAALAALAAMLLPRVAGWLPDLAQRREYRLRAVEIQISQPPRWVPQNLVEQVVEQAALPSELSILDEDLGPQVAEAFRLCPWVRNVVGVTKSFPAAVHVTLEYRSTAAMVELKQGMYPVDPQGVLLPPHDFSVADTKLYPRITNVTSTPQGPAGTEWGDPVVIEAARLAAELAAHWKKLGLAAIVCPRPPVRPLTLDEGVYELLTRGGSRIIWGHAPGSHHPGELSTEQKIGRLQEYVARFGGFDQPEGPYEIDIRHWREISRVPLPAAERPDDDLRR